MATNTYTYGSLGDRWVLQTPTSKANLDIARTKNDANRWTLEALLDDPDDSPFVLANVTTVTVTGPVATAGLLNLWTAETTVVDTDILGRIDFKAPDQTGSGDGVLVTASIYAEADATFSSTVNETDIVFATAHDGAAAERFRITSQGEIGLGGANYGTDGYVLTSTGAGTAVAWEATGIPTYQTMSLSDTFKIEVRTAADDGGQVIWSLGWFKSSDDRWWLLGNTANVDTFARGDAEFYIPTGDIADVPSS